MNITIHEKRVAFTVSLRLSADEWGMDCRHLGFGTDVLNIVTVQLNTRIEAILFVGGCSWNEIFNDCAEALVQFRKWGADSSQARRIVVDVLRACGMPEGAL